MRSLLTYLCDQTAKEGDVIDITFQVLKGNGYYMYSVGLDKEPGLRDLGDTYKLTLGKHQVRARAASSYASVSLACRCLVSGLV